MTHDANVLWLITRTLSLLPPPVLHRRLVRMEYRGPAKIRLLVFVRIWSRSDPPDTGPKAHQNRRSNDLETKTIYGISFLDSIMHHSRLCQRPSALDTVAHRRHRDAELWVLHPESPVPAEFGGEDH